MISPWLTVLAFLATARITRLITRDSITAPLRMRLVNAFGIDSKPAELLQCDWCMGVWVSAATVGIVWQWGHHGWVQLPMMVLAGAQVVGWIASREGE